MSLKRYIRDVPDFPQLEVLFRDSGLLQQNAQTIRRAESGQDAFAFPVEMAAPGGGGTMRSSP